MAQPKLSPACTGWKRDLPGPNERPGAPPNLRENAPNYLDDVYMELSRRSSRIRGVLLLFLPFMLYATIIGVPDIIWSLLVDHPGAFTASDWSTLWIALFVLAIGVWMTAFIYLAEVSPPRDLPIRFNRARRRIYVYGFHMVWWNPFTRWYVTTASYPWDDVRAEVWEQWGATSGGGLMIKWGVSIAIVKPNTNDVIERFHLSTYNHDLDNVWAYVCTYMQQGPQALPPCNIEPRDANDVPAYNLALRWAPRVEWPEAMDWESRSSEGSRVLEGPGQ